MSKSDFFDVPTKQRETSAGPVDLPIFYYDVSVLTAFFQLERERVKPFLEGTGLSAVGSIPGKALGGLAFYEYRDSAIGAYNEVATAVMVMPEGRARKVLPVMDLLTKSSRRDLGVYIIDLPVTTEEAHAAGKEIWGYPKFVTDIPLRFGSDSFEGKVLDPDSGEPIVSLAGPIRRGIPLPAMDLILYSSHQGKLLRTVVDVKARAKTFMSRKYRVQVGDSDHRMAKNLFKLGLQYTRPFLLQVAQGCQTRLNDGVPVSS
jgi:hypothetical protein